MQPYLNTSKKGDLKRTGGRKQLWGGSGVLLAVA